MVLTISSGYDPGYLTRAVATGRENYYLSAVAEHGEPPGIWPGLGGPELGLSIGDINDWFDGQGVSGDRLAPYLDGLDRRLGARPGTVDAQGFR